MAEQLVRNISQDPILDTPFLCRIRAQGREEGREEGLTKGLSEAILDILVARLEPSVQVYRRIERRLDNITDEAELRALLEIARMTSLTSSVRWNLDRIDALIAFPKPMECL